MRLILFILLFPILGLSQVQDSVWVSKTSIINAAKTIQMQNDSIAELNGIIKEMTNASRIQSIMFAQTDQELNLMNRRIVISDGIMDRYSDHLDKEKWFNTPIVHFLAGLGTAYLSSVVYKNIR